MPENDGAPESAEFISRFIGHVPASDGERVRALLSGLVSLDANVLLSFYRYSPAARKALEDVLHVLGDRLFVSHQAATEYWRNRVRVIDDRDSSKKQLLEQLDKSTKSLESALANWTKRTAASEETVTKIRDALGEFRSGTAELVAAEFKDERSIGYHVDRDHVVESLRSLLVSGAVGPKPSSDEWTEWLEEAKKRQETLRPPGYRDASKEVEGPVEGGAGDFLVWRQSLNEAIRRELPLVVVTGDEKDDWWWLHRGVALGPRRELVEECQAETGSVPVFLRPMDLVRLAGALNVQVDPDAAADIERASSAEAVAYWTIAATYELLVRLDAEELPQADVIRAAAVNGGYIGRDEVFEICGFAEDRMLRGFTRPVRRITRGLVSDGYLDSEPTDVLTPNYAHGVVAQGFFLPDEITHILT